jgi:peptidoglycan/LPS O-acetylase OafA/YrhL
VYIYAFPVQQLLAICGLAWLNPALFFALATICTLPLAALSWFAVEKRVMSLKGRFRRVSAPPAERVTSQGGIR